MDSPRTDQSHDGVLSSPLEDSHTNHPLQPVRPDQQPRRSTTFTRSSPATSGERRLSRTRTIRSAHRRHNLQQVPLKAKRLGLDRASCNHLQRPAQPAETDHLPSYKQLFFPEAIPLPQKPSLSDLPPGLLYRRAVKYIHGIDAGQPVTAHPVITAAMASNLMASNLANTLGRISDASLAVIAGTANSKTSITVAARPVKAGKSLMSGSGISCSFDLAEPVVYLAGFQRDGRISAQNESAIIRGKLVLDVQKSAKIKAVTVRFYGKSRTEWPEGIPPEKTAYFEEEKIRYHVLPFFNAQYSTAEFTYGACCTYVFKNQEASSTTSLQSIELGRNQAPKTRSDTLSSRDQRRLSMQNVPQRSFNKSESPATTPQQKGYKTFHPGVYEYSFEIPLDHICPESMDLPMGNVKWMLDAIVERAGTFKPNLHGQQELRVVRAPDQNCMDAIEPIAISRNWEDQLHYDIVVSGKSFPIGGKIPIALKLTPLAKVQCHRIKVYATENVEYFCRKRKVTRTDIQRSILLLERNAGKPLAPEFAGSSVEFKAGGEMSPAAREHARRTAQDFRNRTARHIDPNAPPAELPPPSDSLLGDIDLGLEHLITQTEMEMEVQLPTCAQMIKDKRKAIHPDTAYHQNIVVHHWIKIILRLSKPDPEDPIGGKRKLYEISIDSPFIILSCLATHNHTSLPEYQSGPTPRGTVYECGCPNAASVSPASSADSIPGSHPNLGGDPALGPDGAALPQLAVPQRAHVASTSQQPEGAGQRPIHLMRVPSYNPPAFDADDPPPPLATPPPMYDHVIGTPSVDGLADYFARLSEYDDPYHPRETHHDDEEHSSDEDDNLDRTVSRHGAVHVPNPRTPGGRTTSRSMDMRRDFMFRPDAFNPRLQREREDEERTSRSEEGPSQ